MSTPTFDLSKVQYTSLANSFKNDGQIYTGTLSGPTSIAAGSFAVSSTTITISSQPQFSILFGSFQEYMDTVQQQSVGSGYLTAQWYDANVNNKVGFVVTAPVGSAGALEGLLYPTINGNQVTVNLLVNNPYSNTITITAQTIPWAFIEYTLTT